MHEIKKCNTCGNTYPSNLSFCLNDGTPLVPVDSLIGTVLDGRYRLDSLIGVGGMGDVYRATHIHIDTEFAVKLLKPEFVADQTAIKRFRLEAKAAGRIQHPNAVRVTDFGVTPENIVYLVMELVQGPSLRELIRNEKQLETLRAVNIVRQVCGAVDAAHRSGVIHRDLKPDNIIIETHGNTERVKVLDFGIAKLREAKSDTFLTQAGTIIGTPQYMSPEQCQGQSLDPRSDIYSIGIVLYEMLTGTVPFDGESTLQVVYNQLHLIPRSVKELSPQISEPLANVIMRALEKEPAERQSSAIQLSEELKQAVKLEAEEVAYSMAEPFLVPPLTPIDGPPSGKYSVEGHDVKFPSLADRSTTALSAPDSREDRIPTLVRESRRSTNPAQKIPTIEKRLEDSDLKKSRLPLIVGAAVVLLAVVVAIVYFSRKEEPVTPTSKNVPPPSGMALIQGGKFIMGRDDGSTDEGPAHEVELKSFFLDVQEVTNQEYKKFVDATGRQVPRNWKTNGSYAPDEARLPVAYVTWDDAASYAKWAGKRLPTEAEWEYAARGGNTKFVYPWGNQWVDGYANVDRKGQLKPAPGRSFEKDVSSFGIYDLAGNVSEWVQDNYSEKYGAKPDTRLRVYRGGNFLDAPDKGTNTYRWADYPQDIPADQILRVGFRCAKDIAKD
ncbi:MAG TPA: bifunctional serine/threonine-protein kinase/formylglycine-generating enzyme family protein [Blastocatellia bacterium]|nr:bifunctional serine/threonine-protein kinase/formylglycine-generating enzyme family protein [Blastocatellia bacterium]